MQTETFDQIKHVCDALSLGVVVATLASWMPAFASILSILWMGLRIYETKTVQGWVNRHKKKGV